ncbi:MAG: PAS domain S-box protein [Spirochaetota bacterium]|nr:PAS domain S-box protein [Spirochaetota bacterium]
MSTDCIIPIKTLIVEDRRFNVKVLQELLSKSSIYSFETGATSTLEDAYRLLDNEYFDIVLLDLNLPDSSGLDTLNRIRTRYLSMPIVVITGMDDDFGIKVIEHGAQDFLNKSKINKYILEKTILFAIERKKTEQRLIESEERWRSLVENTPDIIVTTGLDGQIKSINRKVSEHSNDENDIYSYISPEDHKIVKKSIERMLLTGEVQDFECNGIGSDDEVPTYDVRISPVIRDGQVEAINMIVKDISDRQRSEKAILSLYSELNQIFNTITDGICVIDTDHNILRVNKTLITMSNISNVCSEELEGKKCHEVLHYSFCNTNDCPLKRILFGQSMIIKEEVCYRRKDGTVLDCALTAVPLYASNNEINGIVIGLKDITEQKQADNLITAEREKLSTTLQSIGDGVIATDMNENITIINNIAEEITGWSKDESINRSLRQVFHITNGKNINYSKDSIGNFLKNYNRVKLPKSTHLITKDGMIKNLSGTISIIKGREGNVIGYVIIFQDISELLKSEEQLALTQKMQSIGQLSAGIAHEINTPMQYIGDNTKFFKDSFSSICNFFRDYYDMMAEVVERNRVSSKRIRKILETEKELDIGYLINEIPTAIEETIIGIDRVSTIVKAMKSFSHPKSKEKQFSNINEAIESTVIISKNEWKYVAELKTELEPDLPLVKCNIDEINQAILNIIVNASQAIADVVDGGDKGKGYIDITSYRNGANVIISITDNGPGIPEKVRSRIFDPFFTTKEVGKGTGQGLAIAYVSIVEKHGGRLSFESEIGKGTTFMIELPIE